MGEAHFIESKNPLPFKCSFKAKKRRDLIYLYLVITRACEIKIYIFQETFDALCPFKEVKLKPVLK